jgi:tRNA (adenine57-N1/adenine58-N1)-methyltransferase
LTRRNIERSGIADYVTIYHRNIADGIEQTDVDAVVLDLGDPWSVIPQAYNALRPSGIFVSYSPTINQVMKTTEQLSKNPFCNIYTLECFTREILVRPGKTRPATRMIGHTGYLTFARKITETGNPELS